MGVHDSTVTIRLPQDLVDAVDKIASKEEVSRSAIVREALQVLLGDRLLAQALRLR